MKIFIDTANIEHIREINSWGILSGVTTNPTLCAREGREFRSVIKEITEIVDGPISAEVVSFDKEGMLKEAHELSKIAENVIIKIPITPEGLAATKALSSERIQVNMTLVFSVNQALLAARAGASYASIFLGRLDDIGHDGISILSDIVTAYENYGITTEIIAASIRHPMHVTEVALTGVDIATIPYKVIKTMAKHPLTDKGIDRFLEDWNKLNKLISTKK
ncbi:fructose-6-phosphate aldolase [Candidatus Oleimmundimicrobium sp.]|uniref:fructose-6-phosphate aldolase n=1 Tax=Candidatus Oleimmundimicrobium sp. TaxID=3060597 RepID=UPI002723E58A|nr:fructose-6-phosphate aldolase [Candidatus Oleimmundimicrobium sp.]MDO8886093.1 fructose-6-phosphate aldolase [Candidatus Oleimmundimicrobium sp.]